MTEDPTMDTQWNAWQDAVLHAKPIPTERGNPASGYYKRNAGDGRIEAICIYRDENGLQCIRNVYGDGSRMDADAIDELFGSCCMYPISYEVYAAVETGEPWPPEYATRLTMAEQQSGIMWTPELGRKKLGATTLLAENERAVVGDNSQHAAPHELLVAKINDMVDTRRAWLKEIGGEVKTQDHADKVADFKVAFAALEKEAVDAHKREKEPHLTAGREVDKRWKPIGDLADKAKREAASMLTPYLKAQDEERRQAAAKAAAEARSRQEAAPAPVEPVKAKAGHSGRGVTLRTVSRPIIVDIATLAAHLAAMQTPPPDFVEVCRTIAGKIMRAGVACPGAEMQEDQVAA